ncbi:MAG: NAD(P)H-dependent oxidoreductase subunit E, partial [Candidatus Rokubacteria bacterium]|nr:NAD(P)H-dependent oxidoreductase subunit E [Candidatus Rokubacteria bacterium]
METHDPERVRGRIAAFPRERTWLLPALEAVQASEGWLSLESLEAVGEHLRVPKSEVYGVATHYPEFRLARPGAHLIRVCTGVSCRLTGSLECLGRLQARFGIEAGQTTADGQVTLEEADCFFVCSAAPLVEVDGACHGRVNPAEAEHVPVWYRFSRAPHAAGVARPSAPPELPGESARARLAHLVEAARRRARERPPIRLLVQAGSCGAAVGAEEVVKALRTLAAMRGLEAEVLEGACNGICYGQVAVEVRREGWPRLTVTNVTKDRVPDLLHALFSTEAPVSGFDGVVWADASWRGFPPAREHPFLRGQHRVLRAQRLAHLAVPVPGDARDRPGQRELRGELLRSEQVVQGRG